MTNENNIHSPGSLVSNALGTNRATTIIAGLLIGGMIAAASMLPGTASADTPARPVGDPESSVSISASNTANVIDMDLIDMDLIDPGFYDAKLVITTNPASIFDMDLLDPGFYNAKLASNSRVWESPGFDPYENVAAKLVSTSPSLEGLQEDNII